MKLWIELVFAVVIVSMSLVMSGCDDSGGGNVNDGTGGTNSGTNDGTGGTNSGTNDGTGGMNSGTNDGTGGTNSGTNDGTDATDVPAGVFYVQIPSSSAGREGIAVRVEHPGTSGARYPEGAPILVEVQGGHEPGKIDAEDAPVSAVVQNGMIRIQFLMPSGSSGSFSSGGEFDYRGPACQQALADVISYAAGITADTDGRRINDRLPFAMTSLVGVAGLSNGGNLMLQTLASHPDAFAHVSWLVTWESPLGDQYVTADLGGGNVHNPFYEPGTCTLTSCPLDGMEDVLIFDASWSGVSDDPATGEPVSVTGKLCLDANSDGRCEDGEFAMKCLLGPSGGSGTPLRYCSLELTEMMDGMSDTLFPGGWPESLATVAQATEYWQYRDGPLVLLSMPERLENLPWIFIGTRRDHVQATPDHPHVIVPYLHMVSHSSTFIRLNPDSSYMAALSGLDASRIPENEPMQTLDASEPVSSYMLPERVNSRALDSFAAPAAALELSDRVHDGLMSGDLNDPLYNVNSVTH